MSTQKKDKSEEKRGGGGRSVGTIGFAVTETCSMHFPDVKTADIIILISKSENPKSATTKDKLYMQTQTLGITRFCYQVPSTYSEEHMYGYHRQCF